MAILSISQITELIKKPKNADEIAKAIEHEERLRLWAKDEIRAKDLSAYWYKVNESIKAILPDDVYLRFCQLVKLPLPTVEITDYIFTELSKVFDSSNPFFKWEFTNPELEKDAQEYRSSTKEKDYWKTHAMNDLKIRPNSYVVVDLPKEQTTERPEPYFYLVESTKIVDVQYDDVKDKVGYIVIHLGNDLFLTIDEEAYTYTTRERLISTTPHNRGYTPVQKFWKEFKNPLTLQLSALEWYFFFSISKKYLDLYAPFPVYSGYEPTCANVENNERCDSGYIGDSVCGSCKGSGKAKLKIGVGAFIGVEAPLSKDDADLKDPISKIGADIASVEWVTSEIVRIKEEIQIGCAGYDGEAANDQAKNEKQILSGFESKKTKLLKVKEGMERIQKWTEDTLFDFRYGEQYLGSTINYGTDYYLKTVDSLNQDYMDSKNSGKPNFELSKKRDVIYSTEYRDNPDEANRIKVLKNLEPWQDYTLKEVKDLGYDSQYVEDFVLKLNFNTFIDRFEREVGSINVFGEALSFDTKINLIQGKLMEYVNDTLNKRQNGTGNTNNSGAGESNGGV